MVSPTSLKAFHRSFITRALSALWSATTLKHALKLYNLNVSTVQTTESAYKSVMLSFLLVTFRDLLAYNMGIKFFLLYHILNFAQPQTNLEAPVLIGNSFEKSEYFRAGAVKTCK